MLRSLGARNVALMVAIVLIAQLLTTILVALLVIKPQTERIAHILARNVAAISATIATVPAARRTELIAGINRGGGIRVLPANTDPPEDRGMPTMLEAQFMRSFAQEMGQAGVVIWHGGRTGQLWARVNLAGQPYWVSYERPQGWSPTGALAASVALAVLLALIAGVIVQRWIDAPLETLAKAADTLGGDLPATELSEAGPSEIAAVARAFNRMVGRLAAQESDRTFMLAGISHDLRTPLAKIRLALAMEHGISPNVLALIDRQIDQMTHMLGQFLDYARGKESEAPQPCDVRIAMSEALELVGIDPDIGASVPDDVIVKVRRLAFQRSLVNILRNSMTHGAPPVVIRCDRERGRIRLTISDHGPGVAPALLATLHEPFVRGSRERPSDGGAGLGLAIAHKFAAQHGGTLRFSNVSNGGLSVTLEISGWVS